MSQAQSERTRRWRLAERFGVRALLLAVALVLVAVPFAVLLIQVVSDGPLVEIDADVAQSLHEDVRDRPAVVDTLKAVSWLGTGPWLWGAVAAGVAFWWSRARRLGVFLVVTTVLGALANTAVKELVGRARPAFDDPVATALGQSFPSGHAMSSTVCYGALLLVFLPRVAVRVRPLLIAATALLVVAICFTRVALGVHYVTDVVGGVVLGVAWLSAATAAFQVWRRAEHDDPAPSASGVDTADDPTLSPLGAAATSEPHDPASPRPAAR